MKIVNKSEKKMRFRRYVLASVWKSVRFSDLSQPATIVSSNILYIKVLIFVVYPPSVRVIPY